MKLSNALKAFIEESVKDDVYWVERAKLDFARGIELQRRRSGLTYKQVAERIKSSAAYVSKVFRGDSNLTIESMVKLANATNGCLEVRVVPKEEALAGWTAVMSKTGAAMHRNRQLVSEGADTVTHAAGTGNVYEIQSYFKRAA